MKNKLYAKLQNKQSVKYLIANQLRSQGVPEHEQTGTFPVRLFALH